MFYAIDVTRKSTFFFPAILMSLLALYPNSRVKVDRILDKIHQAQQTEQS